MNHSKICSISKDLLLRKYRGCLLGGLFGDCLALPFRGDHMTPGNQLVLQKYMDQLFGKYFEVPRKNYSEITAMTKCLGESLLEQKKFDDFNFAQKLMQEYSRDPSRNYGKTIPGIIRQWHKSRFRDLYKHAEDRLSFGSNGTSRISPIVLFYKSNLEDLFDSIRKSTLLTHAHQYAEYGSVLYTLMLLECLEKEYSADVEIGSEDLLNEFIEKLSKIENYDLNFNLPQPQTTFCDKLRTVQELLSEGDNVYDKKIVHLLGTKNQALETLPTAIYCFLRAQKAIPNIKTNNPLRRCIQYAISLGGDTSGTASIAGTLAGAYFGDEMCTKSARRHCEGIDEITELAENLFQLSMEKSETSTQTMSKV